MDPASNTETLIGLAEVSLALAGFVAVVMIFAGRNTTLEFEDIAAVRVMITSSVGVAFACLTAVALLSLEVTYERTWFISSLASLASTVVISAINYHLVLRHLTGPLHFRGLFWWALAVANTLIHLANVLELFGGPSFGLFVLANVVILGQCGSQFVFVVYRQLGKMVA